MVSYSAAQPTGALHLGNYLGAIRNWVRIQEEYDCVYCLADLHSLTVRQDAAKFRAAARELIAMCIACGLDPERSVLYLQSHVPAHAELAWILSCYTYLGELNRMTQFKDKSRKNETNVNAGLLTYPVLMAADILLYNADIVPVGEDQRQHLELTRDIALRFNGIYGETFTVPAPLIEKISGRVMGLSNPAAKMSKSESDNKNNVIYLSDEPNVIKNKIKRAVTDSGGDVVYCDEKPGIKNLLNIYSAIENKSIEDCEKEFAGAGYGAFKSAVGDAVATKISEIQEKYNSLIKNKDFIDNIVRTGAEKASKIANKTLAKVKKKAGLTVL